MAIGTKINFEHIYELESISEDMRIATFPSPLADGSTSVMNVKISENSHELLPNVYNLAFGPLNKRKQIDDKAELPHSNYSKVFSTILLNALQYLTANPDHYLGVDGSENLRAWYYWRMLQSNFEYLSEFFELYGLKYYVRITRFGKSQYENPFDFNDIYPFPDRLQKVEGWPGQMYNYFIFRLKKDEESST